MASLSPFEKSFYSNYGGSKPVQMPIKQEFIPPIPMQWNQNQNPLNVAVPQMPENGMKDIGGMKVNLPATVGGIDRIPFTLTSSFDKIFGDVGKLSDTVLSTGMVSGIESAVPAGVSASKPINSGGSSSELVRKGWGWDGGTAQAPTSWNDRQAANQGKVQGLWDKRGLNQEWDVRKAAMNNDALNRLKDNFLSNDQYLF